MLTSTLCQASVTMETGSDIAQNLSSKNYDLFCQVLWNHQLMKGDTTNFQCFEINLFFPDLKHPHLEKGLLGPKAAQEVRER